MMIQKLINKVGVDKVLHCLVCFVLTASMALFVPIWLAMAITYLIGVLKEVSDGRHVDDLFDVCDLYADLTGIGLYTLLYIIKLILS